LRLRRHPKQLRQSSERYKACYAATWFCEKFFIFFVGADPEPDDLVRRATGAHRTITAADTDRHEQSRSMNLLEAKTRVTRVLHELTLRGAGLTANLIG